MLHVLTTLLATALLASSTGANVAKNYETHEEHNKTALRAVPKKAYYDPAETYGTDAHTLYNYSSVQFYNVSNSGHGTAPIFTANNGPFQLQSQGLTYGWASYYLNQTYETEEEGLAIIEPINASLDVYINGELQEGRNTFSLKGNSGGNYSENIIGAYGANGLQASTYIWIFDHQEIDPIEEMNENIFDAVGDTITGLSDALASPWEGILNIFYDTTENEVTQLGYLVLIGLGVSITLLVFWTILRLSKQRN